MVPLPPPNYSRTFIADYPELSGRSTIIGGVGNTLEGSFDASREDPEDPGWDVDELLDLDPADYTEPGLFTAVKAITQAEAMLHAKKLQVLAALQHEKRHDSDLEWVADTVAADNRTTITRARMELGLAHTLSTRLPETARLFAAGRLDVHRVRHLEQLTVGLTGEQCAELERAIYPRGVAKMPRQLTGLVKRAIIAIDPDAAGRRAEQAKKDRRVCVEPAPDGMGWLSAFLSAEDIGAVYTRIDHLARGLNTSSEARSMDELRADVLRDLILGKHATGGGVRTNVYVTLTADTLLGLDNLPGELRGYGPLPAQRVRELAHTLRARWVGVLVDEHGRPQGMATQAYRFRGRLAEYIRLRDQTCSHPACNQPADKCDVDHVIPWPRGETTADNGTPECRRHHREKHETGWTIHREDNIVVWTSPEGKTLTNTPVPSHQPRTATTHHRSSAVMRG